MDQPLEGKVALVTGGGVRLGRAIAEGLSRAGADLAVHCHDSREGAHAVREAARAQGRRAEVFPADLSNSDQLEGLLDRVKVGLGSPDILINSAALFERAPFPETALASLDRQWALNARAPFALTQAWARQRAGRGGDVVNLLDLGGARVPWRNYSAYCMTKAALAMLTECLALELAPAIRVNGILPGTVLPPEETSPEELERLRKSIPQQLLGTPRDVVEAVLFFVTGPRFITGQLLAVDGGRALGNSWR